MFVNARAIIEKFSDDCTEILIQTRAKAEEDVQCIELPGGRVEEFEPFLEALKREVFEETGLTLSHVENEDGRIQTISATATVECIKPFAVYQTTIGPVDSLGMYFRCRADGYPVKSGDGTIDIKWISVSKMKRMLEENLDEFCWVDLSGILFYMKHCHGWEYPK